MYDFYRPVDNKSSCVFDVKAISEIVIVYRTEDEGIDNGTQRKSSEIAVTDV